MAHQFNCSMLKKKESLNRKSEDLQKPFYLARIQGAPKIFHYLGFGGLTSAKDAAKDFITRCSEMNNFGDIDVSDVTDADLADIKTPEDVKAFVQAVVERDGSTLTDLLISSTPIMML